MASETTKFQVNFKTPAGSLINVYADTVLDGIAQMQEMQAAIPVIKDIEAAFAGGTPAPAAQYSPQPQAAPVAATPPVATSSPSGDGARSCKHGAMVMRQGVGKNGPWTGWFCPTPKGTPDQCSPQFIR